MVLLILDVAVLLPLMAHRSNAKEVVWRVKTLLVARYSARLTSVPTTRLSQGRGIAKSAQARQTKLAFFKNLRFSSALLWLYPLLKISSKSSVAREWIVVEGGVIGRTTRSDALMPSEAVEDSWRGSEGYVLLQT